MSQGASARERREAGAVRRGAFAEERGHPRCPSPDSASATSETPRARWGAAAKPARRPRAAPRQRGRHLEAGVEVHDAVRRLLVQAQAEPAVPQLEVQADARAPALLGRRHHLDRRPSHGAPGALQRLAQHCPLQHGAAPRSRRAGTRSRRRPRRADTAGRADPGRPRAALRPRADVALADALHPRAHPVTGHAARSRTRPGPRAAPGPGRDRHPSRP